MAGHDATCLDELHVQKPFVSVIFFVRQRFLRKLTPQLPREGAECMSVTGNPITIRLERYLRLHL